MSSKVVNERAALQGIGPGRPRRHAPPYRAPVWRETPPEDIADKLERLAAEHMNLRRIAVELGADKDTVRRWLAEDPVLSECFERGKARAEHELKMVLVEDARNGEKKLNMACVYLLNNAHGWRTEQSDSARVAVSITLPAPMSADEYLKAVERNVVATVEAR